MRKYLRAAIVAAGLSTAMLATSSSALAAGPTGDYARFKYCPYTNPNAATCIYSSTTSGSFKIGNATVPITSSTPLTLQGAVSAFDPSGAPQTWYNAVGADSLVKVPLKVPGGLIGLVDTGGFTGLLISLFNAAVASVNDVYATAEQAGSINFSLANALTGSGAAVVLPIKVHLTNPFLGSDCYIGSNSNPIRLNLTTGTTAPPAPNTPISGSPGSAVFSPDGQFATFSGIKLVDNSFSAPSASNCGYLLLDKLVITAAVNLKEGLPSAAGKNAAILQGTTYLGGTGAVAASVQ